jgi:hypothetical protein
MLHAYEIRPRKDHRGVDLISDALPFGRLWYGEPDAVSNAIDYAKFYSRSHRAVIRVYNAAANVIQCTSTWAISKSGEFGLSDGLLTAIAPTPRDIRTSK